MPRAPWVLCTAVVPLLVASHGTGGGYDPDDDFCPGEAGLRAKVRRDEWLATSPTPAPEWSGEHVFKRCDLEHSDCALKDLQHPTLVSTGGGTQCMTGDPYTFAVLPGDPKKVAVVMDAGGACWEANGAVGTQVVFACSTSMKEALSWASFGNGVLDRSKEENPYRDWTFVKVLYCSGDGFMGNTDIIYDTCTYRQRGYANTLAVKEWLEKKSGISKVKEFAILGSSPGAMGAMTWSDPILAAVKYKKAVVILDSFVDIMPPGTMEYLMKRGGMCNLPFLTPEEALACNNLEMRPHLNDLASTMAKYPDVSFGSIQSKADGTQIAWYKGLGLSFGIPDASSLTEASYYEMTINDALLGLVQAAPNYAVYLVDGVENIYLPHARLYTTSTAGSDAPVPEARSALIDWVDTPSLGSQCSGPLTPPTPESTQYCPAAIFGQPEPQESGLPPGAMQDSLAQVSSSIGLRTTTAGTLLAQGLAVSLGAVSLALAVWFATGGRLRRHMRPISTEPHGAGAWCPVSEE